MGDIKTNKPIKCYFYSIPAYFIPETNELYGRNCIYDFFIPIATWFHQTFNFILDSNQDFAIVFKKNEVSDEEMKRL